MLFSDKADFKLKLIGRDREGHYISVKGTTIQQKEMTIVNTSTPNTETCNFLEQILLDIKEQISTNTFIESDLKTPHLQRDRSTKQNSRKKCQN